MFYNIKMKAVEATRGDPMCLVGHTPTPRYRIPIAYQYRVLHRSLWHADAR